MAEKKVISRSNWTSSFTLCGKAVVNDFTFKIDCQNEGSDYIYNSMNLGVDCGDKHGTVYCSMLGGYNEKNPYPIKAHGKKDDGSDDYDSKLDISWNDRYDVDMDAIGRNCFYSVGLQKTDNGKTFYKNFLTTYDAIKYAREHLEDGMTVIVKGQLKYQTYNGKTTVQKEVRSIALSKADGEEKPYYANFTQSVLINHNSLIKDNIDWTSGHAYIDCRVLDYVGSVNDVEVKGQFPFAKQFEYNFDPQNEKGIARFFTKYLRVKNDEIVNQTNFEGIIVEGGASIVPKYDDLPDDVKELVDMCIITKEQAIEKCTVRGSRETHLIIERPVVRNVVAKDGNSVIDIQHYPERYTEDDLILDYVYEKTPVTESVDADGEVSEADMSWLSALK